MERTKNLPISCAMNLLIGVELKQKGEKVIEGDLLTEVFPVVKIVLFDDEKQFFSHVVHKPVPVEGKAVGLVLLDHELSDRGDGENFEVRNSLFVIFYIIHGVIVKPFILIF